MITKIILKGGASVLVDLDKEEKCRSCGQKIYWAKTEKGKRMPINSCENCEYESHFASCKQANKWRKKQ